jgi:hypothetical protein
MKKRKVISNLPARLPIASTILYIFLMDYYQVDRLWWGIFITVYGVYWILLIIGLFMQEKVDIFKEETSTGKKSKFQQRLEDLAKSKK